MHTGRWLVDGNPQIILFDIGSASDKLLAYKTEFYDGCKIGIPNQDTECNDAVLFGFMVAKFIEEVSQTCIVLENYFFFKYLLYQYFWHSLSKMFDFLHS